MLFLCTVSAATKILIVMLIPAQQKTWEDQKRKHITTVTLK